MNPSFPLSLSLSHSASKLQRRRREAVAKVGGRQREEEEGFFEPSNRFGNSGGGAPLALWCVSHKRRGN